MAILTQSESKVVLQIAAGEVANGLVLIFDEGTQIPQKVLTNLSAAASGGPAVARITSPRSGVAVNPANQNWRRPAQGEPSPSDFASAMRHVEEEVYNAL